MPTLRIAFVCTLFSSFIFSCILKKDKTDTKRATGVSSLLDTVQFLPDDLLTMGQYNDLYVDNVSQEFTTSANKVSVIEGEKGLKITVDPSALELENGDPVSGRIFVNVIELTSSEDLFKSNAATMCDGRLLASGGSYFIGMQNNGMNVRIKKGRSIQVDFPVITDDEMELFYGERNADGDMNWKKAGTGLVPKAEEGLRFINQGGFDNFPEDLRYVPAKLTLYKTLNEKVYYYNKRMTLQELIDTLNRNSKKVFLDTVYTWPRELKDIPEAEWDTAFLNRVYGPRKQYYLKTYQSLQDEIDRLARAQARRDSMLENWQPKTLAGQIQKYYQPSAITSLGWINCDRFYWYKERTEIELDLPVTLNRKPVQFFLVFKNFNGLMNFNVDSAGVKRDVLKELPVGESVTIIGFSKVNGQVVFCKEDLVITKNKLVTPEFKNISGEQMTKMFGKNIRL